MLRGYESEQDRSPGRKADRTIRHCLSCSNCWEETAVACKRGVLSVSNFTWYVNFPTYGKKKEKCPKCRGILRN